MSVKKVIGWVHLWLGLGSGIIVFIVCLTGCIWVFSVEITEYILEPWRRIEPKNQPYKLPSELHSIVKAGLRDTYTEPPWGVHYRAGRTASVYFPTKEVAVNPYSGKIVDVHVHKKGSFEFFDFVLDGHRNLWLPPDIGRLIVNYGTLVFVVLLITGLVLWWPKNKAAAKQRYWFQWKTSTKLKRKNYDLHNIPGFYSLIFLFFIAVTGMTFGLKWFSNGIYWGLSGGNLEPERIRVHLQSDTTLAIQNIDLAMDQALGFLVSKFPDAKVIGMDWPGDEDLDGTIRTRTTYPTVGTYKSDVYTFDRHSLKILGTELYGDENLAGKVQRMYYDIHVGQILGLPGKVLAFLASLIGASLPITGFYIWWGRRKKVQKVPVQSGKAISPSRKPTIYLKN